MLIARASRRPAILCALLLAICTLASYPFAEMGGNDDFAYVRSAKALADTGHMVYFGWSSAMLGWQLGLGALFIKIKLFGSYFTATRASVLLVALLTSVWVLCVGFTFACLYWLSKQMYTTVEGAGGMRFDTNHLFDAGLAALRVPLETAFFLSPILIAFAIPFLKQRTRVVYLSLAGVIIFCAYLCLRPHSYWVGNILAPASSGIGDYVTPLGILELPEIGNRPLVLNLAVRIVI